jgi:hypothetical protein
VNQSIKMLGLATLLLASVALVIVALNLRTKQTMMAPTSQEVAVVATSNDSPLPTPPPPDQPLAPDCELKVKPVPATAKGSKPTTYEFDPPQVLIAGKDIYELAGWLPDNRRLLLTREEPGTLIQQIFTLDIQTKEMKSYGERRQQQDAPPIWLEAQQAVAYTEQVDQNRYQLIINKGDNIKETVADDLTTPRTANGARGQEILFLDGKGGELPRIYDSVQRTFKEWQSSLLTEVRSDGRSETMISVLPWKRKTSALVANRVSPPVV